MARGRNNSKMGTVEMITKPRPVRLSADHFDKKAVR